jgi:hypothetical protein
MTIVHRPGTLLSSPDYLSRLGADLCYDPMLRDYIQTIDAMKQSNPAVSSLPIQPENTPGFQKKRSAVSPETKIVPDSADAATANIISTIYVNDSNGHSCALSNVPISFGTSQFHLACSMLQWICPPLPISPHATIRNLSSPLVPSHNFIGQSNIVSMTVISCRLLNVWLYPTALFWPLMPLAKAVHCLKNSPSAQSF